MNELALFAGIGGGILGGILNGWRTVCAVEIEPYCQDVLLQRQRDGMLEPFPIWDDVTSFDGRPWRGCVDIVTGGFPCQDISSAAGSEQSGIEGERSGLWSEMARVVREVRPRYVLVENSPMLTSRGLGVVLGDLAAMGFDAEWGVFGARHVGAPHQRDRIWIMAYSVRFGRDSVDENQQERRACFNSQSNRQWVDGPPHIPCSMEQLGANPVSGVRRVDDGLSERMGAIKAIGNAQVPAVVRLAWETLNYRTPAESHRAANDSVPTKGVPR